LTLLVLQGILNKIMPYKDKADKRDYQREYMRRQRASVRPADSVRPDVRPELLDPVRPDRQAEYMRAYIKRMESK